MKEPKILLEHILESINYIEIFTTGLTKVEILKILSQGF